MNAIRRFFVPLLFAAFFTGRTTAADLFSENFGRPANGSPITSATGTDDGSAGGGTGNTAVSYVHRSSDAASLLEVKHPGSFSSASAVLLGTADSPAAIGSSGLPGFVRGVISFSLRTPTVYSGAGDTFFFGVGAGASFTGNVPFTRGDLVSGYKIANGVLQEIRNSSDFTITDLPAGGKYGISVQFNSGPALIDSAGFVTFASGQTQVYVNGVKVHQGVVTNFNKTATAFRLYSTNGSTGGGGYEVDDILLQDEIGPIPASATAPMISAGGSHTLILETDGTVHVTGDNYKGQLGNPALGNSNRPDPSMTSIRAIAAGRDHSLFLRRDGSVTASGDNIQGQLGNGTSGSGNQSDTPVPVIGMSSGVTAMAGGQRHSLFLKSDGTVWATGRNFHGQLGDGTTTNVFTPIQIPNLTGIAAISAGANHSLFLKSDGTAWATGFNAKGQLGNGGNTNLSTPILIMSEVQAIAAGESHSLFLKTDGTVWATGSNDSGELGDGTTTDSNFPKLILSSVRAISAGGGHSLFLMEDFTVRACGSNLSGQLGDGTVTQRLTPIPTGVTGVQAISAGYSHSLFLKGNGGVWSTGSNSYGQLGDTSATARRFPVQITRVPAISAGFNHSLFLKSDRSVWATGRNQFGELGDGTMTARNTPVLVMTNVKKIETSPTYSIFLKTEGSVWATGRNSEGQFADGTTAGRITPVQVMTGITDISSKGATNLFLRFDGTAQGAGANCSGQIGDGTYLPRKLPVPVLASGNPDSPLTGIKTLSSGTHSLYLRTNGSVWTTGNNVYGQLGNGTTQNRNIPVQVITGIQLISSVDNFSIFLKTDGSVWVAGDNRYGQLGNGTTINQVTPTQIPSIGGVENISARGFHTGFLKADGTAWATGQNDFGQLGNGTNVNLHAPVQVLSAVKAINVGKDYSLFLKTDETVWATGNNSDGQFGNGTTSSTNIPVQVFDLKVDPGRDWQKQYFGNYATLSAVAGWTADFDNDGIVNLLERAFNLIPIAASTTDPATDTSASGLPRITNARSPDGDYFTIHYLRFKACALSGLVYTPQVSSTLTTGGWRTIIGTETLQSIDDTWERVTLTEIPNNQTRRFARIKVSRIDD